MANRVENSRQKLIRLVEDCLERAAKGRAVYNSEAFERIIDSPEAWEFLLELAEEQEPSSGHNYSTNAHVRSADRRD